MIATEEPVAPRRSTARYTAIAVGVVMALLVVVLATRKSSQSSLPNNPLIGKPAPAIDAAAASGERVSLAGLKGKFVLVNFFNEWCLPCIQEHPELLKFSERHKVAGDAELIAINHGGDINAEKAFLAKEGGGWALLDDPRGALALDYGVRGQPETFVIDPNGYVVSRIVGASTADGLDRLLAQIKAAES
jgi:cytochrome c biogenesis protein CcmG/thiol:disulfide interchange protein DsbE